MKAVFMLRKIVYRVYRSSADIVFFKMVSGLYDSLASRRPASRIVLSVDVFHFGVFFGHLRRIELIDGFVYPGHFLTGFLDMDDKRVAYNFADRKCYDLSRYPQSASFKFQFFIFVQYLNHFAFFVREQQTIFLIFLFVGLEKSCYFREVLRCDHLVAIIGVGAFEFVYSVALFVKTVSD